MPYIDLANWLISRSLAPFQEEKLDGLLARRLDDMVGMNEPPAACFIAGISTGALRTRTDKAGKCCNKQVISCQHGLSL